MPRRLVAAALAGALALVPVTSADAAAKAKTYKNCTALNKVYPHGVGKKHAHDLVRGHTKPVTNFKHSDKLYKANKKSDRDHDGVACEKR